MKEADGLTRTILFVCLHGSAKSLIDYLWGRWDILTDAFQQVMNSGRLRINTERVPLTEIEDAWERDAHAQRLVVIP